MSRRFPLDYGGSHLAVVAFPGLQGLEIQMGQLFPTGQLHLSPAAYAAVHHSGMPLLMFLERHAQGDWRQMPESDQALNHEAIHTGQPILSVFPDALGSEDLWVETAADRSVTTVYFVGGF